MKVRLQDLDPEAVAHIIEAHLWELHWLLERWPRVEVHDDPDALFFISGIPYPVFNTVMRARLISGQSWARIETIIAHFRARGAPLLWLIGPQSRPPNLGAKLKKHGLVHIEDATGMAVDLAALSAPELPPGLVIRRVDHEEPLEYWSTIATTAFELPEFVGEAFYESGVSIGFADDRPATHYLGLLNGKPVATATLMPGSEVAGLHNVSTLPEARRQGIATAMSLTALHAAYARGYHTGVLHTPQSALHLYERLGFQRFCTFGYYVWMGPNHS